MEIYVWYFSAYTFGSFVHNMPLPDGRSFVSIKCKVVNMGSMIIHIISASFGRFAGSNLKATVTETFM